MKNFTRYPRIFLCLLSVVCATFAYAADPKKPMVISFTFDDASKTVATHAFPLMKKHGMLATVYLATALVSKPGYVDWFDVKRFDASGWEIGAHTHTYATFSGIAEKEIMHEIETSTKAFRERGYNPITFAAPLGELDTTSMRVVQQHYASQRDAWGNGGMNALPTRDVYRIVSLPLTAATTLADIRATLDRLEKEGGWLVLQFHDVGQVLTGPWSTTLLPEIVAEVHRRNIPVATVSQVLSHHTTH